MYVDYHLGLAITYGALFLFELVQLGRIIYFRHKFRSFTVAFLTLCFFWAFLRGIFFAFIVDNRWDAADNWIYSIIYWTPINIQFATFSLLVAYYAHLEHKQKGEWRIFKRRYTLIYGISNLLFFWLRMCSHYFGNHLWWWRYRTIMADQYTQDLFIDRLFYSDVYQWFLWFPYIEYSGSKRISCTNKTSSKTIIQKDRHSFSFSISNIYFSLYIWIHICSLGEIQLWYRTGQRIYHIFNVLYFWNYTHDLGVGTFWTDPIYEIRSSI